MGYHDYFKHIHTVKENCLVGLARLMRHIWSLLHMPIMVDHDSLFCRTKQKTSKGETKKSNAARLTD